jgi:hypothetical protein
MGGKTRYKPKKAFRFIDFLIIVFFLSITVVSLYLFRLDLLNTFKLQNVEPAGTVIVKKNTVQRRLGDRVIWDRLNNESPVYPGDLIRVSDVSAATLYIKGNSIELDENTIIRIVLSPDGEGVQIIMTSGTLAVFAEEGAEKISLNLNGQEVKTETGAVVRAAIPDSGQASVKVYESIQEFVREEPPRKIAEARLLSPAANSIVRYSEDLPVLNFQWKSDEEVPSYFLQVSSSPNFNNMSINVKTTANFASANNLGQGLWYWRVMLDLPPLYSASPVFSNVSFFRIEQTSVEHVNNGSISEWLAEEAPSTRLPLGVPRDILLENSFAETPAPVVQEQPQTPVSPRQTPTPPPVRTPPPAVLLSAPQIIQPAQRTTFGYAQLQSERRIDFRWTAVRGASAYIFTLYQETENGRRQVFNTTINNGTRYTLDDLSLLDRGTFVWHVEAVRRGRGNVIEQRGRTEDNNFIIDFPVPGPVQIEDTGILYGNE